MKISAYKNIASRLEELSAVNRRERSSDIEKELIKLRVSAGTKLCESAAGAALIPPPHVDLFAGSKGVPEISAGELCADKVAAAILFHGALLVRGLYNSEHLSRLNMLARLDETPNRERNLPLGCTSHSFFEMLEVYGDCGLLQTVAEYLGGEPVIFAERTKLRHHRAERDQYAAIPWHQDANFFGRKSYALNCWAAVTPCGKRNPGLGIVPTRLESCVGWDLADGIAPLDYSRSMPGELLGGLLDSYPAEYPQMEPGDAILFDEMTLHQTAVRRWDLKEQIVTISWFFRASAFPAWGTPLLV